MQFYTCRHSTVFAAVRLMSENSNEISDGNTSDSWTSLELGILTPVTQGAHIQSITCLYILLF